MPTAKFTANPSPKITLRELAAGEILAIYPLIRTLNPDMGKRLFLERLSAMMPRGYRVVAAFSGDTMVGLSGFWIGMRFWCGRQMDIDNFVVHPDYRNRKIGEKLVAWLEKKALAEACELMVLDVYTHNNLAHRFYHRAGFVVTGYHFTKIPGKSTPYGKC